MRSLLFHRAARSVLWLLLGLAALAFVPESSRAADCVSGRLSQVGPPPPGCTFGDGSLQVDSFGASGPPFNGEHNSIYFLTDPPETVGPAVQVSSGIDTCGANPPHTDPCAPEMASSQASGIAIAGPVNGGVSTTDGQPEIGHVVVSLLDPTVLGSGTISWTATMNPDGLGVQSSGTLDQSTPSYDFDLSGAPAQSVVASFTFTLTCTPVPCDPATNDASVFGVKINVTPAPEPGAAAGAVAALGLLAGLARRRGAPLQRRR